MRRVTYRAIEKILFPLEISAPRTTFRTLVYCKAIVRIADRAQMGNACCVASEAPRCNRYQRQVGAAGSAPELPHC